MAHRLQISISIEEEAVIETFSIQILPATSIDSLSLKTKIGYGLGHVLNDMCSSITFTYLLLYMSVILKFKSWETGLVMLIGQIADALANPIVGYLSDKNPFFVGYGKRKLWHLIGTLFVVVTFPMGYQQWNWSLAVYILVYIIFQFGWASVQNSHLALMPELAKSEFVRLKLASIRYAFQVLSNVVVYVICFLVIGYADSESKESPTINEDDFKNIVFISFSIGIVCSILFHILMKEKNDVLLTTTKMDDNVSSQATTCRDILTDRIYYKLAFLYTATMLFSNIGQTFIPLYLHESLSMNGTALALIPLIIYTSSFGASLVVHRIIQNYGRMKAYIVGSSLGIISCFWIMERSIYPVFINAELYVVSILFGVASCILQVTNLGTVADIIGSKTQRAAMVYGFMTLADKLSSGLIIFFIESFRSNNVSEVFYRNIVALVCGSSVLLAIPFMMCLSRNHTRNGYNFLN